MVKTFVELSVAFFRDIQPVVTESTRFNAPLIARANQLAKIECLR